MISLARIGISQVDFSRLRDGARSSLAADFINTGATAAGSNSNLAEPGSAIFSRRFSAVVAGARLFADSVVVKQQRSAGAMGEGASMETLKKRAMDGPR